MAINRYVHVGLSLDPKVEIVTPADDFTVGENEDIQVFLGTELWAWYPAALYAYLEEVDDGGSVADAEGDGDEAEEDDEVEDESTSVLAPTEVNLGSTAPKPSNGSSKYGPDEVVSELLN